jgi:uncharacterized SAM-binding protein YcdF (DUF218 family)
VTDGARGEQTRGWKRHLFYRNEALRTTWKLRLALLAGFALLVSMTRGFWIPEIGQSLVCNQELGRADAILVDNFDVDYMLFKRAAALQRAGLGARILVHAEASPDPEEPDLVARDIVEAMTQVAGLQHAEIIPIQGAEPIALNTAYQIREFLTKQHIRSVVVVTAGFRSQRSALVYHAVFGQSGIRVSCMPVFDALVPENWTQTWHGIQIVTEQLIKLLYYRVYVLPFVLAKHASLTP